MSNQKIEPSKVTKPIQLVAAWLVGLVLVNGAFLGAAVGISEPVWLRGTLVIASVVNVPVFLLAIFMLQTKFRPQLQEDEYYSKYLDKSTSEYVVVSKDESILSAITEIKSELVTISDAKASKCSETPELLNVLAGGWSPHYKVALCDYLPDFESIRAELKKNNISINKIFGKSTTKNVPKFNHLSFSRDVNFKTKVAALRMLTKYNFDGYAYAVSNDVNPEEIYIGGFGYMNGGFFPINSELKALLDSDVEPSDLDYFEQKTERIKP
ncbi:hypothetical protein JZN58_004281 [Vibrio vulnificus]|nr:hypothetical protein [Vibrio vulnificus]